MKKLTLILCGILLLTALLAGCGPKDAASVTTEAAPATTGAAPATEAAPVTTEAAPATTEAPAPQEEGPFVLYNGTKVFLGIPYADVAEGLGQETRPADEILPCDGSDAYLDTTHHFAGMDVTENREGIIKDIEVPGDSETSEALFNGLVKVGVTQAEAVAALGEPENYPLPEDDFGMTYSAENQWVVLFLDPETNKETVSGLSMILMEP